MKRRIIFGFCIVLALVFTWFVAVDRSWFVDSCPRCGFHRYSIQHRVLSVCVHEQTRDFPSLVQRIAEDLGAECRHPRLPRWHKHRWWGLLVCAAPCHNGTLAITDTDLYKEADSEKVKKIAETAPSVREKFVERVLENHDIDFLKSFLKDNDLCRENDPPH